MSVLVPTDEHRCTFDVDWCGWTQDYRQADNTSEFNDDFDWYRLHFPTLPNLLNLPTLDLFNDSKPMGNSLSIQHASMQTPMHLVLPSLSSLDSFIFVDSRYPRRSGDKARIRTAWTSKNSTTICISFEYHMQNAVNVSHRMGTLRVSINDDDNSTASNDTLWSRTGTQGWGWQTAAITHTSNSSLFQVIFEAEIASQSASDIFIDDYRIYESNCDNVTRT